MSDEPLYRIVFSDAVIGSPAKWEDILWCVRTMLCDPDRLGRRLCVERVPITPLPDISGALPCCRCAGLGSVDNDGVPTTAASQPLCPSCDGTGHAPEERYRAALTEASRRLRKRAEREATPDLKQYGTAPGWGWRDVASALYDAAALLDAALHTADEDVPGAPMVPADASPFRVPQGGSYG